MSRVRSIGDVAAWRMCVGCGACAYGCREGAVSLTDVLDQGIRPQVSQDACTRCGECLEYCPGHIVDARHLVNTGDDDEVFGPAVEIWEGWAADPDVRKRGSSGGVLSALSLYCTEQAGMSGVAHAGMDPTEPWRTSSRISRTRDDILACAGSRYAPASPCDGLDAVAHDAGTNVFIGKPCDTAAVTKLTELRPELEEKIGVVLTHFCAGTPSSRGTISLLEEAGIKPEAAREVHYRGNGWPGGFRARNEETAAVFFMPYTKAWDSIYGHVPLRCRLCADGFGRVADISCGDAWQHFEDDGDPGRSVVVVRTERGREILAGAVAAGYVELTPGTRESVTAGQSNLIRKHREVFGRHLVLRIFGVPVTRFAGFGLRAMWRPLTRDDKRRAIVGTLSRVIKRALWRRQPIPTAGDDK